MGFVSGTKVVLVGAALFPIEASAQERPSDGVSETANPSDVDEETQAPPEQPASAGFPVVDAEPTGADESPAAEVEQSGLAPSGQGQEAPGGATDETVEAPPSSPGSQSSAADPPLPPWTGAERESRQTECECAPNVREVREGARLRFGVQTAHGPLFERNNDYFYSGTDFRLGLQASDDFAVYGFSRVGAYLGGSDEPGIGGLLGIGGGADWTFSDKYFIGAGLGRAIVNNPRMLDVSLRVGGYPGLGLSETESRRHGFSVALEVHHYRGSFYRLTSPLITLGYEAF